MMQCTFVIESLNVMRLAISDSCRYYFPLTTSAMGLAHTHNINNLGLSPNLDSLKIEMCFGKLNALQNGGEIMKELMAGVNLVSKIWCMKVLSLSFRFS